MSVDQSPTTEDQPPEDRFQTCLLECLEPILTSFSLVAKVEVGQRGLELGASVHLRFLIVTSPACSLYAHPTTDCHDGASSVGWLSSTRRRARGSAVLRLAFCASAGPCLVVAWVFTRFILGLRAFFPSISLCSLRLILFCGRHSAAEKR